MKKLSRKRAPVEVRFWRQVEKSEGCWLWIGHRQPSGYGRMTVPVGGGHRKVRAHRVAWELHNGPIPDGMQVCHRCDNPPCVRPEHLFLGTSQDNTNDKIAKGRRRTGNMPKGPAHSKAVLSQEQAEAIRRAVAAGEFQTAVARRLGISRSTVVRVVSGRRYAA